jgi:hypothetical protein
LTRYSLVVAAGLGLLHCAGAAQTGGPEHRGGVGGGMGVVWMSRPELADLVNATPGALEEARTFKTGAEFFGFVAVPLSRTWGVKAEYAYQLASYNIDATGGTAEYAIAIQVPSVILQRVLVLEEAYNVTAGIGGGPRFGSLSARYVYIDNTYSAAGPGFLLEIEANAILGTDLWVHLGGQVRWESTGDLEDSSGLPPRMAGVYIPASLGGFGAAFRLGLIWYLF